MIAMIVLIIETIFQNKFNSKLIITIVINTIRIIIAIVRNHFTFFERSFVVDSIINVNGIHPNDTKNGDKITYSQE